MRSLLSLFLCLALLGCRAPLRVKIYYLDEDQGGLVRKQENETLPFRDAQGYRCMSPEDFEATLNYLKSCRYR